MRAVVKHVRVYTCEHTPLSDPDREKERADSRLVGDMGIDEGVTKGVELEVRERFRRAVRSRRRSVSGLQFFVVESRGEGRQT
jgi:hypothetical protein